MRARWLFVSSIALVAGLWGGVPLDRPAIAAASPQNTHRAPDYDGDGFDDLAVGIVQESVGDLSQAGAVEILYGSATGLGNEFQAFNQDTPGIAETAEVSDGFGSSLVWGDFDDDGFDDLAVGVPGESLPGVPRAGVVHVIYGSDAGLTVTGSQVFDAVTSSPAGDALFGHALASGDLNGDGVDDLAVGAPGAPVGRTGFAGVVEVLFGVEGSGLSITGALAIHQDVPGVPDEAHPADAFGTALAIGDFGRSFHLDLAIGVPGESLETDTEEIPEVGAVYVMYGTFEGPGVADDQLWGQDSAGVPDTAEEEDRFGSALVAANFGNGPQADLAIGIDDESVGQTSRAGAVMVLYGSADGLTAAGALLIHQDTRGMADSPEAIDAFGRPVVAGNFGRTSHADLAIGVSREGIGDPDIQEAGAVHVLYGSASGLSADRSQFWHQDRPGIDDSAAPLEGFGTALAAGNYGFGPQGDLAVGIPGTDFFAAEDIGAVAVLYGRRGGLGAANNQVLLEHSSIEEGDSFGRVLG